MRLRRRWRRVAAGLITLVAVFAAASALGWWLMRGRPAWWPQPRSDQAGLQAAARALENGVVSVLSTARPEGASWVAQVKADDANAWLLTRLPRWLESQSPPIRWPAELDDVQVGFEDGAILIGARLRPQGVDQFISVRVEPELHADGSFWARATSVRVGRLALPAELVLSRSGQASTLGSVLTNSDLREALRTLPQTEAVVTALLGGLPVLRSPRVSLGDGRTVRLIGVDARDGRLHLTCTTGTR